MNFKQQKPLKNTVPLNSRNFKQMFYIHVFFPTSVFLSNNKSNQVKQKMLQISINIHSLINWLKRASRHNIANIYVATYQNIFNFFSLSLSPSLHDFLNKSKKISKANASIQKTNSCSVSSFISQDASKVDYHRRRRFS